MRKRIISVVFFLLLMGLSTGCGHDADQDAIAYIAAHTDSAYQATFSDLNIGQVWDYQLWLPRAAESWVTIWVEGYHDGQMAEPNPLVELSYGLSPEPVQEGSMGLGMLQTGEGESLFLYAPGVSLRPNKLEAAFSSGMIGGWTYAPPVDGKKISLKSGETKVLGAYRQGNQYIRTYDLQDEAALGEMIQEDKTVLLLKIMVEEKKEPSQF